MPQHKYGIYSKQWPIDRNKIISEARKKFRLSELNALREIDENQYLRHVSKMLSKVRAVDDTKDRKTKKVVEIFPKHKY